MRQLYSLAVLEGLLNRLIKKDILTHQEAEEIIETARIQSNRSERNV